MSLLRRQFEARTLDLDAYCRRIGLRGALAPTRDCLVRLIQCHAMAIPFENIEVLAKRVPQLDDDGLQRKMVRQRRGGYCFEQNRLFRGVLQASGFDAHPLEARIRVGVPADVVTARTHLATRVVLDGVDHLVDVGCGGVAPLAPLSLASRDDQVAGTGTFRFEDVERDVMLRTLTAEGWIDCYRIMPTAPHLIDCEMGNWAATCSWRARSTTDACGCSIIGCPRSGPRARRRSNRRCRPAPNSPTCSPTASAWTSRLPISMR